MDRKQTRDYVSGLIKNGAIKIALSWIAKKAAALTVGPLGWLVTLILEQFWDYFGDKLVRWAFRKGCLVVDTIDGTIKSRKIKEAREANSENSSDYDAAVDSVFE